MAQIASSVARLIPADEVVQILGISRPTLYRGIKAGTLPAPVKITARRVGWRSTDIAQFIAGNGCDEVRP